MNITPIVTGIVVFICALAIIASVSDLHCSLVQPGAATVVLACRASRLEARR